MAGVTLGLLETKKLMLEELERMQATSHELVRSSQEIADNDSLYRKYGHKLASAGSLLSGLKKRTEADSSYIWYSFIFFLSVCGFLVVKRLSLLRLCLFAVSKIVVAPLASVSVESIVLFLRGFLETAAAAAVNGMWMVADFLAWHKHSDRSFSEQCTISSLSSSSSPSSFFSFVGTTFYDYATPASLMSFIADLMEVCPR